MASSGPPTPHASAPLIPRKPRISKDTQRCPGVPASDRQTNASPARIQPSRLPHAHDDRQLSVPVGGREYLPGGNFHELHRQLHHQGSELPSTPCSAPVARSTRRYPASRSYLNGF